LKPAAFTFTSTKNDAYQQERCDDGDLPAQKMKNDAYQQERGDEVEEASPHLTSSPKNSSEKYFINLCFFCILNLEKLRKRERIFFASI